MRNLLNCETGAIASVESILLATVVVFGAMIGLSAVRDSVTSEISDVAGSMQDLSQSFIVNGSLSASTTIAVSNFDDDLDFGDTVGDAAGRADNCIVFGSAPLNEGDDPVSFVLSDPGTFGGVAVTTGTGGSATGTIGDGTVDTGFTVTTDTGNISGSIANEIPFRESPGTAGTFTITYDDPLTDVEFWVRNLANIPGEAENLLGNFAVTLSDGTVMNNAAFTIVPDVINPSSSYGMFSTSTSDRELLASVIRSGMQYVTDPTFGSSSSQAAGRLVFSDIPSISNPPGPNAVDVTSISFDRLGGTPGFQAAFSTSGRVLLSQ